MFKMTKNLSGMTLVELMIVVIVIGILASIAYPTYTKTRERTIDKEAQAILGLIRAAEREYRLITGKYYPATGSPVKDFNAINGNLSIDLINNSNWNYEIRSNSGNDFTANLTRPAGWGYDRDWFINSTLVNATCEGKCPY